MVSENEWVQSLIEPLQKALATLAFGEVRAKAEWADFVHVLMDEIRASRKLQQLLTDRSRDRKTYQLLHRPLRLK